MLTLELLPAWPRLRDVLTGRREALADFTPLHREAGVTLLRWVRQNFDSGGRLLQQMPSGWPALSPATLARRRQSGQGRQPLVNTGRLRNAFRLQATSGLARLVNPLPYAMQHQQGLGVPRRPLFPETVQARQIILPAIRAHMEKATR